MTQPFISDVSEEDAARERRKAKEIKTSQWWKNQKGKGVCYYCKDRLHPSELTMDHIVPVIRGGKSSKSNIVPSCKACNSKKKHMLPIEWEEYVASLD